MLNIVIEATPIQPQPSGVGLYVANLIRSLHELQVPNNFQLGIAYQPGLKNWLQGNLSLPDLLDGYPNTYVFPIPVRISNLLFFKFPGLFQAYFEDNLKSPTIVHGTNFCVYPCKNSRKVMSIYDLIFFKYPDYIDSVVETYAKRVQKCLQWTDLIITISESSKQDIVNYLGFDPNRIYVTPLASRYSPGYLSAERAEELQDSVNFDFSKPYLLFVGTIEPRKNIETIIYAFNQLKQNHKIEHQLVLIGKKGWRYQSIFDAINGSPWKSDIHHLDYLSDELTALFYSKADSFVYPSYYEGFGLPVLEAMTLGAPVITSNTSSLPEVAGDAALLVDPNDPDQLVDAILNVIADSQLRRALIDKGQQRARLFSWKKTAEETLKAYNSLISIT